MLEDKLAAADQGDTPPPGAAQARPELPLPDPDREKWIAAVVSYGSVARAMLPEKASQHWTDERLHAVGVELANCAKHYGWTYSDAIGHPLWKLAAVAFPLVWPLAEPYVMPMVMDTLGMGKAEKEVNPLGPQTAPTSSAAEPAAPGEKRPPKVEPVG